MEIKKLFFLSLFFLFSFSSVFAYTYTVTHSEADGVEFWYCDNPPLSYTSYPIDTCYDGFYGDFISSANSNPFQLIYYDTQPYWKGLYLYKTDKRVIFTGRYPFMFY